MSKFFVIFVLIFGCALSLLLSEGILRIIENPNMIVEGNIFERDEVLGTKLIPYTNMYITFKTEATGRTNPETIHIDINSKGIRDHAFFTIKDRQRIIILGDSFVMGWEVQEEDTISENLEVLLNNTEVLNFGVSGYGTIQYYLLLREEALQYNPDIVITTISHNDGRDNVGFSQYSGKSPDTLRSFLSKHSKVYQLISKLYSSLRRTVYNTVQDTDSLENQLDLINKSVNQINTLCLNNSIQHIVVVIPDGQLIESGYNYNNKQYYEINCF